MLGFFERADGGRERWSRRYWRSECDWDPTFSEFGVTNPHRGVRLGSNYRPPVSRSDAEKRVTEVVTDAKAAADRARSAAAKLAFWMTAALIFGAFAASLAAVEGGQLRVGSWDDRRLKPRAL
jgi:hypothetical protein